MQRNLDTMEYLLSPARQERQQESASYLQSLTKPLVNKSLALTEDCLQTDDVIFVQQRIGQYGLLIDVPKIRTIAKCDEDQSVIQGRKDNRAKGISKVLRYTHVDELLQLQLVLDGEMDLDGYDRPFMPNAHSQMEQVNPELHHIWSENAFLLRPSLFSLSAVYRHLDGGWNNRVMERSMKLSNWYMQKGASRSTDLLIRNCTLPAIAGGTLAYTLPKIKNAITERKIKNKD